MRTIQAWHFQPNMHLHMCMHPMRPCLRSLLPTHHRRCRMLFNAGSDKASLQSVAHACMGHALQARGKFGLRTRTVRVHEAAFIPEAEQQLLSTALGAWQRKAEGGVAASALEVGVAGWRLLHRASRRALPHAAAAAHAAQISIPGTLLPGSMQNSCARITAQPGVGSWCASATRML